MGEFNNRMTVQRNILQIINQKTWGREPLLGLSSKAIDRWLVVNLIDPQSRIVQLIKDASAKLFFLATKSQEQITEDYQLLSEISIQYRMEYRERNGARCIAPFQSNTANLLEPN